MFDIFRLLFCVLTANAFIENTKNNNSDFSVEHADGVFDDKVRVRVDVEQPIIVNDIIRMALDPTRETTTDACSDFYRYCNSTGAQYDPMRLQCSCEDDCDLLGNCCWDSPLKRPRRKQAGCYLVSEEETGFFMVDRCPGDWVSSEVRRLCESTTSSRDPFTMTPVSSSKTTYKNVFCAICNGERHDTTAWSIDIGSCKKMLFGNCSMAVTTPFNVTLAPCDYEAISDCPDENDPYSGNCDLYYAPVSDRTNSSIRFKNKFCAFCHGVEDLGCVDALFSSTAFPQRWSSPFSIVFHVDFWNGNELVGVEKICHQEPQVPVCREITCVENVCIPNITDARTLTTASCTKWILDGTEYVVDQNGELALFNESFPTNKTLCKVDFTFGSDQLILTVVCFAISIVCLVTKIVMYLFFEEKKKKISQQIIFVQCISILLGQSLFLIGSAETQWGSACVVIGIMIHYFYLVSLFWTNVLSFDIWRTFSTMASTVATSPARRFLNYNLYCWVCPLVFVILALVFEWVVDVELMKPGYGLNFCWISRKLPLLVFFVCPLTVLFCVNASLFSWTAYRIASAVRAVRVARDTVGPEKIRFVLYVKLALIMGMTWIFGFSAAYVGSDVVWCFFIAFNSFQGAFLLLAFSRLQFKAYLVRLRMFVRKATQATNSRSTKSSQDYSTSKM